MPEREMTPPPTSGDPGKPIEDVEEEVAARNPDPETRREAFEREAAEQGRSEEATEVADEVG